jgi:hypothetical protein
VLPVYSKVTKLSAYSERISGARMTPRKTRVNIHSGAECQEGRPWARTWTWYLCGVVSRGEGVLFLDGGDEMTVEQLLGGSDVAFEGV